MTLERWSPSLAAAIETIGATISSATDGISVTSGAANTKGSWTTSSAYKPTFDWGLVHVYAYNETASQIDVMLDIGIDDGSGNTHIIVPDLHVVTPGTSG